MNKTIAMLILIAAVLLGLGWGVRQYGNSRETAQELSTVKEAVSEAVAARKDAVLIDASQAKANAVQAQRVRSVLAPVKKEMQSVPNPCADAVGDAERVRLLNRAITETNRVIATTSELSE